jgi:hypothetical protein
MTTMPDISMLTHLVRCVMMNSMLAFLVRCVVTSAC